MRPSPPEALVLMSLWLVVFATSSQFLLVSPLLPEIGEELAIPHEYLGLLVSVYAAMVGVFALLSGPISDHVGRARILRGGSLFMAVVLLFHAVAESYGSLLLLRALAGAASGVLSGAAPAYVGDVIPYERRGYALGVVMSGMAFGQIVGIPAGTLLAAPFGFQAPFVVVGLVMLVAYGLAVAVLNAPHAHQGEALGVGSSIRSYLDLLGRPGVAAVSMSGTLMMFGVSTFMVYMPTWVGETFGARPADIAILFGMGGLASAIGGPLSGRLSDRVGRKILIVTGSVGLALVLVATERMPSLFALDLAFFAVMALASLRMSPLNALLTAMVGPERRGTLMSLTMATSQVGFAIGSGAAGWIYDHYGFAGDVRVAAVGTLAAAALVAFGVREPQERGVPA